MGVVVSIFSIVCSSPTINLFVSLHICKNCFLYIPASSFHSSSISSIPTFPLSMNQRNPPDTWNLLQDTPLDSLYLHDPTYHPLEQRNQERRLTIKRQKMSRS